MWGITCATSSWPAPSDGYSSCSGVSEVNSGTNCIVTCNRGYKINGPSSSRCGNDGIWSPNSSPNCQGKKLYSTLPAGFFWFKIRIIRVYVIFLSFLNWTCVVYQFELYWSPYWWTETFCHWERNEIRRLKIFPIILKKYRGKIDYLIHKMLFIKDRKPSDWTLNLTVFKRDQLLNFFITLWGHVTMHCLIICS